MNVHMCVERQITISAHSHLFKNIVNAKNVAELGRVYVMTLFKFQDGTLSSRNNFFLSLDLQK